MSRRTRVRSSRPIPEGIRITKVGLWYVLFSVVVAVAATNTGNNALYMVLALMLGLLVASGFLSRQNVRGLGVSLSEPGEIYSRRPFLLRYRLVNRGWLLPRWFLLLTVSRTGTPVFVPYLPRRAETRGTLELMLPRRGRHTLRFVHLSSLFPFGFFRKGLRHRVDLEVLAYPEIFDAATVRQPGEGPAGEEPSRRRGRGQELYALRHFRQGDDPRSIHWKQTARTGEMVFMERESETSLRLSVQLDNGTDELASEVDRERFEQLVSEAATAAVDYLSRGYQVELVTRDGSLGYGTGWRHRLAILEALALVEPCTAAAEPLRGSDPQAPALRLKLDHPLGRAAWDEPEVA